MDRADLLIGGASNGLGVELIEIIFYLGLVDNPLSEEGVIA